MPNFYDIAEGVRIIDLTDKKFKTFRIAFKMLVPLEKTTASDNAMVISMVNRVTKEYQDYTELSRKLASLYGAGLYSDVGKMGDNQVLSIALSGISGRYAFGGEKMEKELLSILLSALFDPLTDERGLFPSESFIQEKRQILESIDADVNDKKIFAMDRCFEELFVKEKAGISKYGKYEDVENVKEDDLLNVHKNILKKARFEIFVSGDCDFKFVENTVKEYFNFERAPYKLTNETIPAKEKVKYAEDKQKLTQSKLVMGFKSECEDNTAFKLMAVILGASPTSKLFVNVREKMSLCYYCSARAATLKKAMIIESGVENKNLNKAKDAILNELDEIKKGNVTEEELTNAKLALYNGLNSVEDSLYSKEVFYQNQIFDSVVLTPEEQIEKIRNTTLKDVIKAAESTKLDTVYTLKGTIK